MERKKVEVRIPEPSTANSKWKAWARSVTAVDAKAKTGNDWAGNWLRCGRLVDLEQGDMFVTCGSKGSRKQAIKQASIYIVIDEQCKICIGEVVNNEWAVELRDLAIKYLGYSWDFRCKEALKYAIEQLQEKITVPKFLLEWREIAATGWKRQVDDKTEYYSVNDFAPYLNDLATNFGHWQFWRSDSTKFERSEELDRNQGLLQNASEWQEETSFKRLDFKRLQDLIDRNQSLLQQHEEAQKKRETDAAENLQRHIGKLREFDDMPDKAQTPVEFLRDLAERLRHIPINCDTNDIDRLETLASDLENFHPFPSTWPK